MAADPKNSVRPDSVETGALISLACVCGKKTTIKLEHVGTTLRCHSCGRGLVIDPYSTSAPPQDESLAIEPEDATVNEARESNLDQPCMLAPAKATDEIGRLGPYRVLQVLGIGGMGVVYKAEDPNLGRIVALKAMLPSAARKKSATERFLREARAAAALKHDHVVSIFQVGEDRGIPFLAMEFLEGESLEDCLKRERRLSVSNSLRIAREIADGLVAAHERGLIHRDIKPANVWMEKRPVRRKDGSGAARVSARAKILDFGLARGAADATITQSGAIMGTPAYMSLEQARGERVDGRCDLYSLGVVLYRMLTGRLPFEGNNLVSVLAAMVSQTPIEPCVHEPSIPASLNVLILRLVAKNPDDRPASAAEVYDALCDIEATFVPLTSAPTIGPDSTVSAPHAPKPVAPGPPRRWPILALAIGAMAVAAVVFVFLVLKDKIQLLRDDQVLAATATLPTVAKNDPPKEDPPKEDPPKKDPPIVKDIPPVTKSPPEANPQIAKLEPKVIPAPQQIPPPPPPTEIPVEVKNSIGMRLVYIRPGKFMMGSPKSERVWVGQTFGNFAEERASQEMEHEIEITGGFCLGKYPVTQKEYEEVMGENPSSFSSKGGRAALVAGLDTSRYPVEQVSWNDAKEFCRKLSLLEGKAYRLPREAEWEYACRAGTKTAYNVGPTLSKADANFGGKKGRPESVGSYKANAWGLCDMHGNVWQWCEDFYDKDHYRMSEARNPVGPAVGWCRVIRGGNWGADASSCRSAYRDWYVPRYLDGYIGFRVAYQADK
jgi:eukaryotic-like serine/threonine-protein kinase